MSGFQSFSADAQFGMQQVSEACSLDDDMVDGDLGDGMGVRTSASSTRKKSQSFAGVTDTMLPGPERIRRSSQIEEAARILGLKTTDAQNKAGWKLSRSADSLVELSKDELTVRLQEATEMVDLLCCELEAAHRYLEGKYEALKILQGKAILDKATSHTKSLLQKSEERVKALEKEVNNLQWELSFTQIQMKRSQQTWEQKHSRLLNENKTLGENLEARESEVQQLQAENSALSRQCLELLSMLSVKEQKTYQESKPQFSAERDASVLELAVLGACQCFGAEACPCSRTAAASRKQLVQLQQKLEDQSSRREEALMVADAFRIAFEQQLRKRSEHFMLLAEANGLKSHYDKTEGVNRSPLLSVTQRLKGLLPSSLEVKMPDDLIETLYRLLDLLNDKEEALAHQRKVSIMLAHSAEELQRKLQLDSQCPASGPVPGPVSGPVPGPVSGLVPGPASGPASGPVPGPVSGPASGPASGPVPDLVSGPASATIPGPVPDPVSDPVSGPVPGTVPGPVPDPVSSPVSGPASGPVPGPVSDPASGSVPGPVSDPAFGHVPGPVSDPASGHVSDPVPGPVSDPVQPKIQSQPTSDMSDPSNHQSHPLCCVQPSDTTAAEADGQPPLLRTTNTSVRDQG